MEAHMVAKQRILIVDDDENHLTLSYKRMF